MSSQATTTLTLTFVRETELARLYRNSKGSELWIPRSVTPHTTKLPRSATGGADVRQVEVYDWWLEKNQFPAGQPNLL